ncbi:hypothetical protein [Xanthobacter autotrophicus]|uniref:hypothetical protein n=1 Tax=Xanthobacter autotrophicus TaxID=280 RepID=UPI003729B38D
MANEPQLTAKATFSPAGKPFHATKRDLRLKVFLVADEFFVWFGLKLAVNVRPTLPPKLTA